MNFSRLLFHSFLFVFFFALKTVTASSFTEDDGDEIDLDLPGFEDDFYEGFSIEQEQYSFETPNAVHDAWKIWKRVDF